MKTLNRSRALLAALPLAGIALAAVPAAAATGQQATGSHTVHVSAKLTVTHTAPPVCKAGVCVVRNHGTGTLTPYGAVTFSTVVTADTRQPPCGTGSQWVNRIIRTITTSQGKLVLHEAACCAPSLSSGARSRRSGPPTAPTAPASSPAPAARAPTPPTRRRTPPPRTAPSPFLASGRATDRYGGTRPMAALNRSRPRNRLA